MHEMSQRMLTFWSFIKFNGEGWIMRSIMKLDGDKEIYFIFLVTKKSYWIRSNQSNNEQNFSPKLFEFNGVHSKVMVMQTSMFYLKSIVIFILFSDLLQNLLFKNWIQFKLTKRNYSKPKLRFEFKHLLMRLLLNEWHVRLCTTSFYFQMEIFYFIYENEFIRPLSWSVNNNSRKKV